MRLLYYFTCAIIFSSCIFTQTKPPEAVTVVAPTSVTTTIDSEDSSYLRITVDPLKDSSKLQASDNSAIIDDSNNYSISLLGKSLINTNIIAVDSFLHENKTFITSDKVIVHLRGGAPGAIFIKIANVLKKIGIVKFKIAMQ